MALGPAESVFVVLRPGAPASRLVSATRDGRELLRFEPPTPPPAAVSATNTFTMAAWVRPEADTILPLEATAGTFGRASRNDAVYAPPGHEVWGPGDIGAGFAVGRNGICVHEHGANLFSAPLVWASPVTGCVHVAVVYRDGVPALYVDGRKVRTGLRGSRTVHPGVAVAHKRSVAPFSGEMADVRAFDRALEDREIAALASEPPRDAVGGGGLDLVRGRIVTSGDYVLRTADGRTRRLSVALPAPRPIDGPWRVTFDPRWGGPAKPVAFERLKDWSQRAEEGIRYYSGTATYRTRFQVSGVRFQGGQAPVRPDTRHLTPDTFLDLGSVEVMARVRVNGKDCGIAWKPPYRVDITDAVREGANDLEIDVVNLWINRLIGDEQLPLDSEWKDFETLLAWPEWFLKGTPRPSGRFTFTSCRHYTKDTPLVPSGLIGPVTLVHEAGIGR